MSNCPLHLVTQCQLLIFHVVQMSRHWGRQYLTCATRLMVALRSYTVKKETLTTGNFSKWVIIDSKGAYILARQPDRVSLHLPRTLCPGDLYIRWNLLYTFRDVSANDIKILAKESTGGGAEIPYLAVGLYGYISMSYTGRKLSIWLLACRIILCEVYDDKFANVSCMLILAVPCCSMLIGMKDIFVYILDRCILIFQTDTCILKGLPCIDGTPLPGAELVPGVICPPNKPYQCYSIHDTQQLTTGKQVCFSAEER